MRLGPAHRVPLAVLAPLRPFLYKQVQKPAVSMAWCQRLHKAEGWPCGVQKLLRQQDINLADDPPQAATSAKLRADLQFIRSEEHTSELQSLRHLVCRLLLEKKK